MTKRNIGIMGGTFNPIHNGHLMLARYAYQQFHLNQVYILPNRMPMYKGRAELVHANHRAAMIQLAIAAEPYMEFSDLELRRSGPTYSIDTIRELQRQSPADTFYFIIGGDSLIHLTEWKEFSALLQACVFVCAPRNGVSIGEMTAARTRLYEQVPESRIFFL